MTNDDLVEQRNLALHSPECNHRAKHYANAQNQNADCLMMTASTFPRLVVVLRQRAMPCDPPWPPPSFHLSEYAHVGSWWRALEKEHFVESPSRTSKISPPEPTIRSHISYCKRVSSHSQRPTQHVWKLTRSATERPGPPT